MQPATQALAVAPGAALVARRGLPAGAASASFSLLDAARALADPAPPAVVYVFAEAGGGGAWRLRAAGAEGGAGAARLALSARLAPHGPGAGAALALAARGAGSAAGGGTRLRLTATRALAPHEELLLWPDAALLALCDLPFLAPQHITEGAQYRCPTCGARFEQPNALKLHLWLRCAAPCARAFWRRLLQRLAALPAAAPPAPAARPRHLALSELPELHELEGAWWRGADGAVGAGGAGGHACLFCGKLYSRRYGLKIHVRTHTGYKPLRCAHCARRFGDPSNLNKHVRLHARAAPPASPAARPHACPRCGAPHARRRDLERHLRARHGSPSPPPLPAG